MSQSNPYPTHPVPNSEHLSRYLERRRLQNNATEESAIAVRPQLLEEGYTSEKYRVGAPPLQLLPLWTKSVNSTGLEYRAFRTIVPLIQEILRSKGIRYDNDDNDNISLVHRTIPQDDSGAETLTIYIIAEWDEQSSVQWLLAVDDIRELLVSNSNARPIKDVKVEIIDWEAEAERSIDIVEHSHPIVSLWPRIQQVVHYILGLNQKLSDGWRSIDVVRLGPIGSTGLEDTPRPLPVVISITVDWGLDSGDWLQAERLIEQLLRNNQLRDVKVEFERGDVF